MSTSKKVQVGDTYLIHADGMSLRGTVISTGKEGSYVEWSDVTKDRAAREDLVSKEKV